MTTDELMKKILEIAPYSVFNDENGFIQIDTGLTRCNDCEQLIITEIHEEELGMCIDCADAYFSHSEYEMENN